MTSGTGIAATFLRPPGLQLPFSGCCCVSNLMRRQRLMLWRQPSPGQLWVKAILCLQLKAGGKFADCAGLAPLQFGLWYRGAVPHPLRREVPLAETDVPPDANMELSLVISGMQTVPTAKAHGFPEALRSTPVPVAIQVRQTRVRGDHVWRTESQATS